MTDCINLKKRFGNLFEITFSDDFDAEPDAEPSPYRQRIVGRGGIIQPFDRTRIVATVSPAIGKRIGHYPDTVNLGIDEDGRVSVICPADMAETVASSIGIRQGKQARPFARREIDQTRDHS